MSNIVSSVTAYDGPVEDHGRRRVKEVHTDVLGKQYVHTYLSESSDNINSIMTAYAAQLDADLSNSEINQNVSEVTDADV